MKLEKFDFDANLGVPLWIIYGSTGWPQMICVAAKRHELPRIAVWGYSVYRNSPGFRTLGQDPYVYFAGQNAYVFTNIDSAMEHLKSQITPKKKALEQLQGWNK